MDDFDILLKEKARKEPLSIPDSLESIIMKTLNNLPQNRKKRPRPTVAVAIVAALLILPIMTVYGKDIPMVNSILKYFQGNSGQRYSDDAGVYEKYSIGVSKTISDNGVSVSIDNIACDDNFLVLFYTVEGDVEKTFKGRGEDIFPNSLFGQIIINGKEKSPSNNDRYNYDSYLTPDGQLKGIIRADISNDSLPSDLNIDFLINEVCGKKGQWNFKLSISKEAATKDTKVVIINKEAYIKYPTREHNIKIEKVSFTPFGNQILISEKYVPVPIGADRITFGDFALFDDQGNTVDVLPASIIGGGEKSLSVENSFEFIKCNKNSKFLTLVPICYTDNAPEIPYNPAGVALEKLPLELKLSNKGSLVIEKVDFSDMDTRVYYTKKGVVTPIIGYFQLVDENGQNISAQARSIADREKGLYVDVLPKLNRNEKYKIKYFTQPKFDLLYKSQIEIPLT